LYRGQQIIVYPTNLETRIRSIQSHGRELELAQPGMRTAINLPDIAVNQVKRGNVVTVHDLGEPGSTLVVFVEKSSRLDRENPAARPLKSGSLVYLHHGTSRVAANISHLEGNRLGFGERTIAQL